MTSQKYITLNTIAHSIFSRSYLWHLRSTRLRMKPSYVNYYVNRLHGGPLFSVPLCISRQQKGLKERTQTQIRFDVKTNTE